MGRVLGVLRESWSVRQLWLRNTPVHQRLPVCTRAVVDRPSLKSPACDARGTDAQGSPEGEFVCGTPVPRNDRRRSPRKAGLHVVASWTRRPTFWGVDLWIKCIASNEARQLTGSVQTIQFGAIGPGDLIRRANRRRARHAVPARQAMKVPMCGRLRTRWLGRFTSAGTAITARHRPSPRRFPPRHRCCALVGLRFRIINKAMALRPENSRSDKSAQDCQASLPPEPRGAARRKW